MMNQYLAENFPAIDFQLEAPRPAARLAANTVDAEAAEPIFSGRVRIPNAPLLDTVSLQRSIQWNQAMHPKVSGIPLAELCARLERYIDRPAMEKLMRQANLGMSIPTLATLLAHQFQRKTCRRPTIGQVTKPCTTDGRIAEDTLDALGFVYHQGQALNSADRRNHAAANILGKIPASSFAGEISGLTASTWWSYMVSPPWLGLPIKNGIHLVLLKRLRGAQRRLMAMPAYAGLSPVELGKALGLQEEHKGARPGTPGTSMHLFGLGIDINYTRNPWVSNPQRDTSKLPEIMIRAARLVAPTGSGGGITARHLHNLATTHRDTAKIHNILAQQTRWLAEYFALTSNIKRLESLLPTVHANYPAERWLKQGESPGLAAQRWAKIISDDLSAFATAVARGGNKNAMRHGFMDLRHDLVIALRDGACLAWGAVDFGAGVSGDIMHFDCRIDGIGRTIAKTARKGFVPTTGHPCLSAGVTKPVQREFEQPGKIPNTPVGRTLKRMGIKMTIENPPQHTGSWLAPFTSNAIPKYKDSAGKDRSTDCGVYVPKAAWKQAMIDLLVFFHGDRGPCMKTFEPDPKISSKKFELDLQIDRSGRRIALAVPTVHWIPGQSANVLGKWKAANLNHFVEEVLDHIGRQSGVRPKLGNLIIAGHSHAFAILTPLASEFNQNAPSTRQGALTKLKEVWGLDSTYGQSHVHALKVWANKLPSQQFVAVLAKGGSPLRHWQNYYRKNRNGPSRLKPPNLILRTVSESHCAIPGHAIGRELSKDQKWNLLYNLRFDVNR